MDTKKKYEPWEELPEANLKKVRAITEAVHNATNSMEHNLATDTVKVPGQNWACVSFVSPEGNQKNKSLGMKIRGVFDTNDEAVDYVKRLIRLDPTFDIFICEMYNWCLIPPDPEKLNDQVYQNEELNKIVGEYKKNQIYAKEHFEERKREMIEQAADAAKKAALEKIKEEENALQEIESGDSDNNKIESVDTLNEDPPSQEIIGNDDDPVVDELITRTVSQFVSASDVMDSMMNSECPR